MLRRMQGLVFAMLGVASMVDAWRITSTVRPGATFDLLGPDRYMMVLAGLMIVSGLLLTAATPAADTITDPRAAMWPLPDHAIMLLALVAFALAMPLVGFAPACFAFFILAFAFVSRWSLVRGTLVSASLVAGLYAVFVRLADVPLPRGAWLE